MRRQCRVSNCLASAASSFSAYCSAHKARFRRHGDPEQRSIAKKDLRPYLQRTQARIRKNPDSPAWATLEARWRALVDYAEGIVKAYLSGRATPRHERIAAEEVIKLAKEVSPREVVEVTMAMVLMQEMEPRRFKSDRAFWTQLARRVRGLADVNFGERYVHATRKVKGFYREKNPKAMIVLGHWLAETLGIGGVYIARAERAEEEQKQNEREGLHTALAKLA